MRQRSAGILGLLVAISLGMFAVPSSAYAHDGVVNQRFYADSGDQCRMGYTEGTLGWQTTSSSGIDVVHVDGHIVDRPASTGCGDGRFSVGLFTAFSGSVVVDSEQVRADNGDIVFKFDLTAVKLIGKVVVQVCRLSSNELQYCGKPVEYQRPVTIQT